MKGLRLGCAVMCETNGIGVVIKKTKTKIIVRFNKKIEGGQYSDDIVEHLFSKEPVRAYSNKEVKSLQF